MSDECGLDTAAIAKLRQLGGGKFVADMAALFFQYAPQRLAAARATSQASLQENPLIIGKPVNQYCLSEYLDSTGFD
jgi:hypothetical protein